MQWNGWQHILHTFLNTKKYWKISNFVRGCRWLKTNSSWRFPAAALMEGVLPPVSAERFLCWLGLSHTFQFFGIHCFSVLLFPLNPQTCCQPPALLLCWVSHCTWWAGLLTHSEMDKAIQMLRGCNESSTAASPLSGISSFQHAGPEHRHRGENHEITVKGSQHQLQYTAG